jgi:hypothetical protein
MARVVRTIETRFEAALCRVKPGTSDRYLTLARLHRQSAMLAASFARSGDLNGFTPPAATYALTV